MKKGKLPEQVLIRSVLKCIESKNCDVFSGPTAGQGYAAVSLCEDEVIVVSTDTIALPIEDLAKNAITAAANGLASSGATPIGFITSWILPEEFEEKELKAISRSAKKWCEALGEGLSVIGGHTITSDAVKRPVLTVNCIGKANKDKLLKLCNIHPGDSIVLTKEIALEAASIIAKSKEEELETRFTPELIANAADLENSLSVLKEAEIAMETGKVSAMLDLSEGGVFSGLWKLAQGSGLGFEVNLKDIAVRQECIEICEYFDLNPYFAMSAGAMLIVTSDGEGLVERLEANGITAGIIGQMNDSNGKIVKNGEEVRYLEKPQMDEVYKLL